MSEQPSKPPVALSDEAIDWLVRLCSPDATARDRLAFLHWRARSPAHEAAAREAEEILKLLPVTRQAVELGAPEATATGSFVQLRKPALSTRRRFLVAGGAVAASAAAMAVAWPAMGPWAALYADYSTSVGERRRLELPDGSVAFLNTASALSVDFGPALRRVVLHAGEAFFEVARDPLRPFVAAAGTTEVRALGTAFALRRGDAGEQVIVTDGTVEVTLQGAAPVRLTAGQQIGIGASTAAVPEPVDADVATAWQRGKLIFNRRPLASVVAEIQRYRSGRIVIASERLRRLEVTGVFDLDDTDHLLRAVGDATRARLTELPLITVIS